MFFCNFVVQKKINKKQDNPNSHAKLQQKTETTKCFSTKFV